jgi:hypothetical protein
MRGIKRRDPDLNRDIREETGFQDQRNTRLCDRGIQVKTYFFLLNIVVMYIKKGKFIYLSYLCNN